MPDAYRTLFSAATDEYIVNKSRFLCHAAPAETEEAALAFLKEKRERYKDASHNCYAYVIGQNAGIMRYSDDGEPSGTAGLPIIEVVKARGVVNCCVVITRYFGGVLLGAGGLTRAYAHSCALALQKARVVEMLATERYMLDVSYPLWDRTSYALKNLPVISEETSFGASVCTAFRVRAKDAQAVLLRLAEETNGQAETIKTEELFAAWDA